MAIVKNTPIYDTIADVQAASIASTTMSLLTNGLITRNDRGGGFYLRVASQPSHSAKIQSRDGTWWERANVPVIVATLPAAASVPWSIRFVSDALNPTFADTVGGGGTIVVGVYSDGTVWRCLTDPQLSSVIRQNIQSSAYTLVLTDGGKHIYHPVADTTPRTWTIPANASVAFPIGTVIAFENDIGAGDITIAITTDTLVLVGIVGSTGSRTLASGGSAIALKVTATRWRISGEGLT